MTIKKCTKCGKTKKADAFNKKKASNDGLFPHCIECRQEHRRQHNETHKEYMRQYREKNKEKLKEHRRQYTETNNEKRKEYNRKYKEANKEKVKEHSRKYYETNKEEKKEYSRKYRVGREDERRVYKRLYDKTHQLDIARTRKRGRDELSKRYIKCLITQGSTLKYKDIPNDLVEMKRTHLRLGRLLKEMKT